MVLLMVTMTMASTLRKRFNLNKYPELYERNDEVITESINIFHRHCVKAYREAAIPSLIFIDDKAVCKDESISQGLARFLVMGGGGGGAHRKCQIHEPCRGVCILHSENGKQ